MGLQYSKQFLAKWFVFTERWAFKNHFTSALCRMIILTHPCERQNLFVSLSIMRLMRIGRVRRKEASVLFWRIFSPRLPDWRLNDKCFSKGCSPSFWDRVARCRVWCRWAEGWWIASANSDRRGPHDHQSGKVATQSCRKRKKKGEGCSFANRLLVGPSQKHSSLSPLGHRYLSQSVWDHLENKGISWSWQILPFKTDQRMTFWLGKHWRPESEWHQG